MERTVEQALDHAVETSAELVRALASIPAFPYNEVSALLDRTIRLKQDIESHVSEARKDLTTPHPTQE